MKILFTGGGTGGHFYPIIAVAEAVRDIVREEKLLEPALYFAAPDPYDERALAEHDIKFVKVSAGKIRLHFSFHTPFDLVKAGWGIAQAMLKMLALFPDVVFGKGGYGSFPALIAARFLGIPVIIHESDTVPGRVNLFAAKFARRIAISFPEAAQYFPASKRERVALTGVPVRRDLQSVAPEGGREYLKLESDIPVVLILGGSSGAEAINETVLAALPELVKRYSVIHQTGRALFASARATAAVILDGNEHAGRYQPFDFLDVLATRMAAGAADVVVTRAGATTLFQLAAWGKPSLVVPIPRDVSRDQYTNAFAYAAFGACVVIEQENFTPSILLSEIARLLADKNEYVRMSENAKRFAAPDAARVIAREILEIALEHER